ncbi:MAG: hypothetical protein HZA60_03130 [Deltaproteobacteria bacterium]|nr:hypothetical protein [Deltaproteobacteria bacterium]
MLQNVLFDGNTLTIAYDRDRDASCLRCDLCVARCPAGIDVRNGAQRECIACAECIDACRSMTARRGIDPFIAYRGRILRGKAALAGAAPAAAGLAFAAFLALRPGVAFDAHWEEKIGNSGANRYGYAVRNGTGNPMTLRLGIEGGATLMGDREITVPPRSRRAGKLLAKRPGGAANRVVLVASGPGFAVKKEVTFP